VGSERVVAGGVRYGRGYVSHVRLMQPQITTRGSLAVSTDVLEIAIVIQGA